MSTEGDRRLDVALSEIGGKGVFATEVQAALLDGRGRGGALGQGPAGGHRRRAAARSGAGAWSHRVTWCRSARRWPIWRLERSWRPARVAAGAARCVAPRPSLRRAARNTATRLAKADEFDAIRRRRGRFRASGHGRALERGAGRDDDDPPGGSEAALAIECRDDDSETAELLAAAEHAPSRRRVDAERAFLAELGGDCTLPAGAHAGFAWAPTASAMTASTLTACWC